MVTRFASCSTPGRATNSSHLRPPPWRESKGPRKSGLAVSEMGEEPSEVTSEHWSGKSLDRVVIKINRLDAPIASGYVVEMSPLVSSSKCAPTQETRHPDHQVQTVTRESPPCAKIELFRSLFRGRTDVYPRRFESRKTGKAGYAPACANEWVRGICEKPRIKCADCPNRRFLPVTDDVIRWHLSGRDNLGRDFVMGVYPMLQDESCFLLAADFDRESWREDAGAFRETCHLLDLPVALERSRSGNGGHIWFFFEEAISASLAGKLGSHLLTETMENRPEIGFGSYDRLFPNQDTLPRGGFGNLIALPLQKQ